MQGYKLLIFIFIISLIQIFCNAFLNYIKEKSNLNKSNTYILNTSNLTINIICFMYNLYFILTFFKLYLFPELIDIFFTAQSLI